MANYVFDDDDEVTLSNLNTRTGVKKKKKAVSHSSYWLDKNDDWDRDDEDPNTVDRAVRLAATRRAVGNFVRILTNDPSITVKFNDGNSSYTDGKTVVIAAQDKPKDFDIMVGLALHEASHCLLTNIPFYGAFTNPEVMIQGRGYTSSEGYWKDGNLRDGIANFFHPDFRNIIVTGSEAQFRDLLDKVMLFLNMVEDRRIDQYVYNTAVGYRPYYGALYKKYFLSTAIDKALKSGQVWNDSRDIESYVNRLINIMNEHSDASALPGLDEMVKTFDIENIHRLSEYSPNTAMEKFIKHMSNKYNVMVNRGRYGYKGEMPDEAYLIRVFSTPTEWKYKNYNLMPPTWILANELLAQSVAASGYVYNTILPPPAPDSGEGEEGQGDGEGEGAGQSAMNEGEVSDAQQQSGTVPDGQPVAAPVSAERLKRAINNQRKFLNGDIRKTKISNRLNEMVKSVEQSGAEIVEVGSKTSALGKIRTPCLVINNVTKQTMFEDWFLFGPSKGNYGYNTADQVVRHNAPYVSAGIRMGQVLAQRLSIRNDPTFTHYTRQPNGKIDRRVLAQLGMDITNVFKKTRTDKFNPVTLYLSLDASGSMSGEKWGRALTVATALSYLADKVRDVNVVVMARGGSDTATVAVLHDSRKQKFAVARPILELTTATGATPESLCFEATFNYILDKEKSADVFFINFSDGEPSFHLKNIAKVTADETDFHYTGFSGQTAIDHCRQMMALYRQEGVKILSYFITDGWAPQSSKDAFKKMYGQEAEFVDVRNVTQVLKTLQKLLSDRSTMEAAYG